MTAPPDANSESTADDPTARDLYVEFEVAPADTCSCPLSEVDGEVIDVRQQLADDTCQTDTTIQTDGCQQRNGWESSEVMHTTSEIDRTCPCSVFSSLECIPQFTEITDERVGIETYLPDRELLSELVEELRPVVEELHLRRLKRVEAVEDEPLTRTVTLELNELTEKQQEAAVHAVTAGYYTIPRETSFEELADELAISKPALSQRLNAVESKLATAAFADTA